MFKDLLEKAKRWNEAQVLRDFICAFERKALEVGTFTAEKERWIKWAKEKADWYDPLRETDGIVTGSVEPRQSSCE